MPGVDVTRVTQAWLRSTRHIQVPEAWLDACIDWVTDEAGGVSLPIDQIKQQVLDQWLLTDLRDLAHPILPAGVSEAQKTQLEGCYCLQLDSLLDVSQPAYTQLQHVRGSDCSNEEVTAVTQATQKPWEAKPKRMLMMQLTDGVQSLEGMEYQPIPSLNTNLPPGTKLQVKGQVVVRLGVLLLKSENVTVLGGEVEQLVERHSQSRILCRTLGLPEEDQQQEAEDANQEPGRVEGTLESGYGTLDSQMVSGNESSENWQDDGSMRMSSHQTTTISTLREPTEIEPIDEIFEIPDDFDFDDQPQDLNSVPNDVNDPEDFDDIPMEELDDMLSPTKEPNPPSDYVMEPQKPQHELSRSANDANQVNPSKPVSQHSSYDGNSPHLGLSARSDPTPHDSSSPSGPKTARYDFSTAPAAHSKPKPDLSVLNYLSILQTGAWPPPSPQVVRLKAFVVTLLGSLRSSGGEWRLPVTISDGTGYLDVDLCDTLLSKLIGFSASESRVMRKDPVKRGMVEAGIQHCQRELVDMCCVMTVRLNPTGNGTVLRVDPLSDKECCELQRRVLGSKHGT